MPGRLIGDAVGPRPPARGAPRPCGEVGADLSSGHSHAVPETGADPLRTLAVDLDAYLPIGLLVLMAIGFVVFNLVVTHVLGPRGRGAVKESTYESGMNPIGTARKRFDVRFYILAMTFLVFDVEIIFLYPWAVTYSKLVPQSPEAMLFLGRIMFFVGTSVIAYVYAWRKGVFRWD